MKLCLPHLALTAALLFVPGLCHAQSNFNGEVLIAPPPPNWTGGTPEKTDKGVQREWRRNFLTENGVIERVVILRSEKRAGRAAAQAAGELAKAITANCPKPTVSKIKNEKAPLGTFAAFTAQCPSVKDSPADTTLFAMGKVLVGDFYTFAVQRTWLGHKDDPGSPANSPKTGQQWATYFTRISVCNTLADKCDPALVHAHPRFTTMRPVPVTARPVVSVADAIKAARALGVLTGRAEVCGEDVEPLTTKIGRMFSYVTANDQESSKALAAFKAARAKGMKEQGTKSKESCGQVLRDFRQHPSRVGAFHRYIERFL